MSNSIFNPALVGLADLKVKAAFVDAAAAGGGDPAAAGGGDPAAAGGDPAAAMGGDPAASMGGAPAGPDPMAEINMLKQQIASMGAGGGGMGGGMEPIKPKIDVNVEIMQIKKMLARVVDSLGIQIPAAEMTATSTDLTQMAQQSQAAGAGGGAAAPSAIQPPAPIQAAAPGMDGGKQSGYNGRVFDPAFAPLASGSSLATEASRLLNALKSAG